MRMGEMLTATARRVPERVALCFEDRCWTFGELDSLATRVAAGLAREGSAAGGPRRLRRDGLVRTLRAVPAR